MTAKSVVVTMGAGIITQLSFVLLISAANAVHADVYKWKDVSGLTHYGDAPPDGVHVFEKVVIVECNTEACREEQEQRFRQAMELNRRTMDRLGRRGDVGGEKIGKPERRNGHAHPRAPMVLITSFHPVPLVTFHAVLHRPRLKPLRRPHRVTQAPLRHRSANRGFKTRTVPRQPRLNVR